MVEIKKIFTVRLTDEDLEIINDNFVEQDDTTGTKVFSRILDTAMRKKTHSKTDDLERIKTLEATISEQKVEFSNLETKKKELDDLIAAKFSEIDVLNTLNIGLTEQLNGKETLNTGLEESINSIRDEYNDLLEARNNEILSLHQTVNSQGQEIEKITFELVGKKTEIGGLQCEVEAKATEIERLKLEQSDRENTIIVEPNPLQLELIEAYRSAMIQKRGAMITQLCPGFIEPITENTPKSKGNYLLNTFLFMIRGYKFDLLPQFTPKKIERVFASYLDTQKGGQQ